MTAQTYILSSLTALLAEDAGYTKEEPAPDHLNVIIILADDLGYGDLGTYGGEQITPNIDRLAENGMKFTDFYASPICSPSRASLLTGCYPQRVDIPTVIGYNSVKGINPREELLPEILKRRGYRTAIFGKWHLGDRPQYSPLKHGFDEFFGTLASNDMGPDNRIEARRYGTAGLCLLNRRDTVAVNPEQWNLTKQYTEQSLDFIARNKANPFFLYLAYNAPHTPLFIREDFAGKSGIDIYHDVLMEIDWSVGQIMHAVEQHQLTDNTLIVFLSDNGPWLIFGNQGGNALPFSGGKKQTLEGGVRVPCIMSLPGKITPNSVCTKLTTIMDLYPTIAKLTGAEPGRKIIDGKDLSPLWTGDPETESAHEVYFYYYKNLLQAVRAGDYKLQLSHLDRETPDPRHPGYDGHRGRVHPVERPLTLYDLKADPGETIDRSNKNPEIVTQMLQLTNQMREKLGDDIQNIKGSEVRPYNR